MKNVKSPKPKKQKRKIIVKEMSATEIIPVICTFIQTMTGALNKGMLIKLGYTLAMQKKCPSLFNSNGFEKMKSYLALNGVKSMEYYCKNRKNYFSFFIKKEP